MSVCTCVIALLPWLAIGNAEGPEQQRESLGADFSSLAEMMPSAPSTRGRRSYGNSARARKVCVCVHLCVSVCAFLCVSV